MHTFMMHRWNCVVTVVCTLILNFNVKYYSKTVCEVNGDSKEYNKLMDKF